MGSHSQILSMLEGGNEQLEGFFSRHRMSSSPQQHGEDMSLKRYHTKAACFYRQNLAKHVEVVSQKGVYKGREAARRQYSRSPYPRSTTATTTTATTTRQPKTVDRRRGIVCLQ